MRLLLLSIAPFPKCRNFGPAARWVSIDFNFVCSSLFSIRVICVGTGWGLLCRTVVRLWMALKGKAESQPSANTQEIQSQP